MRSIYPKGQILEVRREASYRGVLGAHGGGGMVGRRMMLKREAGLERTSGVQKREGDSQAPLG